MKKRMNLWIPVLVILMCLLAPASKIFAATGRTSVSVSADNVNIGDTVTVTVKAVSETGNSAYATMTLEYNPGILEFTGCSATYGGGNGSISVAIDSFTVTFKAISAGTSGITVTATDGVDFATAEELSAVEGSSTSITVLNAAGGNNTGGNNTGGETGGGAGNNGESEGGGNTGTKLSADNSLKSLLISPGTLSPQFKGSTVNYSATVANNVTSIAVTAEPANAKAIVESVSGNANLAVGENIIKIVVKAENGTTATYTIKVTRQAADSQKPADNETPATEPETEAVSFKNDSYYISQKIPEKVIPEHFSKITVLYHGTEYEGLGFDNGTISLLYLVKADKAEETGILAIYDETRDILYPYLRFTNGNHYVIPLLTPVDAAIPDTYSETEFLSREGESVSAYQLLNADEREKDFYLFYGINQTGEEAWYQYDVLENTYQRAIHAFQSEEDTKQKEQNEYLNQKYQELKETYRRETGKLKNIIYSLIFTAVVLVIIIINILVFCRNKKVGTKGKKSNQELDVLDFNDED